MHITLRKEQPGASIPSMSHREWTVSWETAEKLKATDTGERHGYDHKCVFCFCLERSSLFRSSMVSLSLLVSSTILKRWTEKIKWFSSRSHFAQPSRMELSIFLLFYPVDLWASLGTKGQVVWSTCWVLEKQPRGLAVQQCTGKPHPDYNKLIKANSSCKGDSIRKEQWPDKEI